MHSPDISGLIYTSRVFLRTGGRGGWKRGLSQQHSGLQVCRALISRGRRKGRDWRATVRALRGGSSDQ